MNAIHQGTRKIGTHSVEVLGAVHSDERNGAYLDSGVGNCIPLGVGGGGWNALMPLSGHPNLAQKPSEGPHG